MRVVHVGRSLRAASLAAVFAVAALVAPSVARADVVEQVTFLVRRVRGIVPLRPVPSVNA